MRGIILKILILAAGIGSRLSPITETRAKPMIYIAGKPALEWVINNLKESKADISDIIIVVGYKKNQIIEYFGNGFDFGVKISYIEQEKPRVENAILAAKNSLKDEESFLIVHADIFSDPEMITRCIQTHKDTNSDATVSVTLVDNPHLYGVASIDSDAKITRLVEKPKDVESNYAVSGVYLFRSKIFDILEKTKFLDQAIQEIINNGGNVYASVWEKEWVEITYPWDILRANRFILSRGLFKDGSYVDNTTKISSIAKVEGPVYIGKNVLIRPGAVVQGPCVIQDNSVIGTNALVREYSTIGKNVVVGFGDEIKNSIIFDNTSIGRLSYIGDSVIGKNVEFGAGAQTWNITHKNKPIKMKIKEKDIEIPRRKFGAIIGDNAFIGINVSIFPGKLIGCNSIISAGANVEENVDSNILMKLDHRVIFKKLKGE
ncbi:MAG: NTP transferase domain-containing protein [Candidatus Lokiarchaeota archaeon]|nr:NTP transferase domain-containing protein [Candidatus Lokiarchaeota archaeon]